jgi:hypothetical protein
VRLLGSIAFGVLIAVLGWYWLPSVFWDHGPYVFTSDRLEGALVAGAYSGVVGYGVSSFFDSDGGSRAILFWLGIAVAAAAIWALWEFTTILR